MVEKQQWLQNLVPRILTQTLNAIFTFLDNTIETLQPCSK